MDTSETAWFLRIIALEIVSTLPFPVAAWMLFYKLHTPPTKGRRIALAAAIIAWMPVWRFLLELYLRGMISTYWLTPWFIAGLAAFALLSGNIRRSLFSVAFYEGLVLCVEAILDLFSSDALNVGRVYDNSGYLTLAICGLAVLVWALFYRRLMRKWNRSLSIVYGMVTALVPFLTVLLLYVLVNSVDQKPETPSALFLWGGLFALLLFLLNIVVFFFYIKLNTSKTETADSQTLAAAAIAEEEQRAAAKPFALSELFIEKYSISPAQRKVVEAVLAGMPDKEIADSLGISVNTVKRHGTTLKSVKVFSVVPKNRLPNHRRQKPLCPNRPRA